MEQSLTCTKNTQQEIYWTQKTKECQEKLRNLKTGRIDDVVRFVLLWLKEDPPDLKGSTLSLIIDNLHALHGDLPRKDLIRILQELYWIAGEDVLKHIAEKRRRESKMLELWETIAMA